MLRRSPMKRTRFKPSPKCRTRRALVKALDAKARQQVFERDGFKCVRCGKSNPQWAHVISRSRTFLRWLTENALSLCNGCHIFWWHKNPLEATAWFQAKYPDRYELLMSKLREATAEKLDVRRLREMLEA